MTTDGSGSSAQFTLLMDAIKKVADSVDSKLSAIKRYLMLERESADDRLVRDKLVDSVGSALDGQDPPAVEKAKTLIKEGEKMINVRQKH